MNQGTLVTPPVYKSVYKSDAGRDAVIAVYNNILSQWPVQYRELSVNTGYGKTSVIQCGDPTLPPLILLHGTSSNATMWIGHAAVFSSHHCVYAVDIPGEPGKSEEKQYPLKDTVYFDWLAEVMQQLHLDKVILAGISLGAWIAVGLSVKHPEMVKKLVLLSPSGIGPQKISFAFKALFYMCLGEKGHNKISQLVNGKQPLAKEAVEYADLIARNFNLRTEPVPIFSDDELRKLSMPVLLYAGRQDVLLDQTKTASRLTALLPNADVRLLRDQGHVLTGFTGEITDFIQD